MQEAVADAIGSPNSPKGGAIIYASTRKNAEKAAQQVSKLGYRSAAYHAGLSGDRRAKVNAAFAAGELDDSFGTSIGAFRLPRTSAGVVSNRPRSHDCWPPRAWRPVNC